LTLLGQIVAEQHRFERFAELARHMGTRQYNTSANYEKLKEG
jgi:hypothetical protein